MNYIKILLKYNLLLFIFELQQKNLIDLVNNWFCVKITFIC